MPTSDAGLHRRLGISATSTGGDSVVDRSFLFYDATDGSGTVVGYYPAAGDTSAGAPVPASVTIPTTSILSYSGSPQLDFGFVPSLPLSTRLAAWSFCCRSQTCLRLFCFLFF